MRRILRVWWQTLLRSHQVALVVFAGFVPRLAWSAGFDTIATAASGIIVGLIAMLLVASSWIWAMILIRKGPRALFGYEKVTVNPFNSAVLYRGAAFETELGAGLHWINSRDARLVTVDLRPEVFQIAQGTITADRFRVVLRCHARIQVVDARAAIEVAMDYRAEMLAQLQSTIKALGQEWLLKDLYMRPDEFNEAVRLRTNEAAKVIGVACRSFEFLDAEPHAELPNLEQKDVGFQAG